MSVGSGHIPNETIDRLFSYLRPLMCVLNRGSVTVSSRELAEICTVNPSVVRKDFSYIGSLGTRGVGYNVRELIESIRRALKFDNDIRIAVVGVGNIGRALLEHPRFGFEGFKIVAAFDSSPEKVGQTVGQVTVEDAADLEKRLQSEAVQLVIVAVPEICAPDVARRVGDAGVNSVLSFTPCGLAMPDNVNVTSVDLSLEMARLVYHSCSQEGLRIGDGAA